MCTVVVSFDPDDRVPVKLLGVRDELTSRAWRPPARHWQRSGPLASPQTAPLIGGIDEQAGGTWLAVHPGVPRLACVLNARGPFADPAHRRSRGELPLRAAAEGPGVLAELAGDPDTLAAYDPFHLISATPAAVTFLTWRGVKTEVRDLAPGTHFFTNAGHAYPADPAHPQDPQGEPKAEHFAAKFAAARPSADPALSIADAWGDWLTLTAGDDLDPADPGAIIARRELAAGQLWGSTSVTLVGLGRDAFRYDFQPSPGRNPDGWYSVGVALAAYLVRLWCRYAAGQDHRHRRGLRSGRGLLAGHRRAGGGSRPLVRDDRVVRSGGGVRRKRSGGGHHTPAERDPAARRAPPGAADDGAVQEAGRHRVLPAQPAARRLSPEQPVRAGDHRQGADDRDRGLLRFPHDQG
jgi:hypothetical protein